MAQSPARGSRVTGTQRAELATQLGQRYAAGESIRAIAEDTRRSFGFVHGLIKESGVDLRSRGGATRGPAARGAAPASATRAAATVPAPDAGGSPVGPGVTPPTTDGAPAARKAGSAAKGKGGKDPKSGPVTGGRKVVKAERRGKDKGDKDKDKADKDRADKRSAKKGKR